MAKVKFEIRDGETAGEFTAPDDASLYFIGRIETPFKTLAECPRQGVVDGPLCRIEVFQDFADGLKNIEQFERLQILYWLDLSRRDLLTQNPGLKGRISGTFALRSPQRPNPIGSSMVELVGIEGRFLTVRGLDCVDGTALLDIKPDRCKFSDNRCQ